MADIPKGLPHPDFPMYIITKDGNVWSKYVCRFLKQSKDEDGYLRVSVKGGTLVHRLVAQTYLPNPRKLKEVNHKDGNPSNNHVKNLEWCTPSENVKHAHQLGLIKVTSRKKIVGTSLDGKKVVVFPSITAAARAMGVDRTAIGRHLQGKSGSSAGYVWKYDNKREDEKIDISKWKDIEDNPNYVVSRDGRVASKKTRLLIKTSKSRGHVTASLCGKKYAVHRLVARAYTGLRNRDFNSFNVYHKDGNKSNNNVENLRFQEKRKGIQRLPKTNEQKVKSVVQYTKWGEYVAKYKTITQAEEKTGICHNNISKCCSKNTPNKSAGGYVWRYSGKEFDSKSLPEQRKILCTAKSGKFVAIYDSLKEAARLSGIPKRSISQNLTRGGKSAYNKIFKYISFDEARQYE
jgi:hypothetical protein